MKNVLNESPYRQEHGGALYATRVVGSHELADADVLDIGCGFGWFTVHALEAGARSVTGIEPSDADLETARLEVRDERARFLVASAQELPFDDASFDLVAMWEVIEHVPTGTERQAFSEVARVLRPGGRFHLSTPYRSLVGRVTDPAWWLIGHRHYSRTQLVVLATSVRLEVVNTEVRGGVWQILHMNNMYVAKWLFRRRPFLESWSLAHLDREWLGGQGCTNVFLTCEKR